jgi:2-dehydropantoate 2-reductase
LHQQALLIMKEIKAIDESKGHYLPDDIIEQTFLQSTSFPYHTPTSLQLDVQSRKINNELSLFAGAIINLGHKMNIPVLETERIYNEIIEFLQAVEITSQ